MAILTIVNGIVYTYTYHSQWYNIHVPMDIHTIVNGVIYKDLPSLVCSTLYTAGSHLIWY